MKCPECNKELRVPTTVILNMESYGNSCLTVTDCCSKLVRVNPVFTYTASRYTGDAKEDDWGKTPKK